MGSAAHDVKSGGKFSGCLIVAPPQGCLRDHFGVRVRHPRSPPRPIYKCMRVLGSWWNTSKLAYLGLRSSNGVPAIGKVPSVTFRGRRLVTRPGCLIIPPSQAHDSTTHELTCRLHRLISSAGTSPLDALLYPSRFAARKCSSRALCRRRWPPLYRATRPCFASLPVGSCLWAVASAQWYTSVTDSDYR